MISSEINLKFQFVCYWKPLEIAKCEEEHNFKVITGDLGHLGAKVIF